MKKTKITEIVKFLKYMGMLSIKRIFTQIKTRYWCGKYHKSWEFNPLLHGSGRYNYCGYRCSKCGSIHYEFEINETTIDKI